MRFPLYYSRKIAFSKDNKNNLSRVIVFIGRLSVALGIIVSLITISTGLGSTKAIKERMADFSGHINVKSTQSNSSYNSSILNQKTINYKALRELPTVAAVQKYATVSGILRTADNVDGIIFKGVGKDFDKERFQKFIIDGKIPDYNEDGYNNDIIISELMADELHLKPKDSVVTIFSKEDKKPIYRKFRISGVYKTDIKLLDDYYVIGDINQVRKIQDMGKDDVGGLDIFVKNINNLDKDFAGIEAQVGYNNFAEKVTDRFPQVVDFLKVYESDVTVIITLMVIVVVINIIMILLLLIIDRTNTIGLLKTLGATNGQIRTIFIYYTLLILIPGLIIGNLVSLGLLLIQKYFGIIKLPSKEYFISVVPVDLNPIYVLGLSAGILIISALSLILPSYIISKISPVKAIKYN